MLIPNMDQFLEIREKIGPTSRLARLVREEPAIAEDLATIAASAKAMPKGRNFH